MESSYDQYPKQEHHNNSLKSFLTCGEDPGVRRRFDVSSIPQYNCGYERALQLRQHYLQQRQDVTSTANSNAYYQISHHDQSIINAPDVFFRRTPPPDNDSHTTVAATTLLTNLPMTTSRHQIPQHYFRIKG
ncbi:hypothetical protein RhiirC2_777118 [Rhizophagus irregularis]|uniref:Uncharacterized protein n=1 Tax=Rhizophagus irregularis TaxID=588596 RepID=A0A2N1NF57_9GLOM|nr:hypothetical protein RhiirC2_777118 [Rhizophagus irregularis]